MSMLISIAWRNLWRNRGRTSITLLAIAGGMTGMLTMHAMMSGMGSRIIEGLIGSNLGHIQIHREGYRERGGATRTVDNAELVLAATRRTPGVEAATGRIYGFAHASIVRGDDETVRGGGGEDVASPMMALVGLDPESEGLVTDIPTKITQGGWFDGEAQVIVGAGLAKRHHIEIGDALLPSVIDMHGATRGPWAVSDQVPRVVGIMRSGVEAYDGRVAFMPRTYLAKLMGMEDRVHEIAIRAENAEKLPELAAAIRASVAKARSLDTEVRVNASSPFVITPAGEGSFGGADPSPDAGLSGDAAASPEPVEVRLVGVEPRGEEKSGSKVLSGRYLSRAEDMVITKTTAAALDLSADDRVAVTVPIDCGDDVPASDCPPSLEPFIVAGIVDESDVLDGRFALVSSQVLDGNIAALAPGTVNELGEADRSAVASLASRLHGEVTAPDEVLTWTEIAPEIAQYMAVIDVMPVVFFVIIFFAIALGIVNTMLMATFERTREIGLMRALGMRSSKVVSLVMWESVLLALAGIAAGLVLGMPLIWYWEANGMNLGSLMTEEQSFDLNGITIDPRLWPTVGLGQIMSAVITIGLMTSLSGLWPALRAARLLPTEALRQE
jgi:ABC-type lipoprotein release transport system permease subunit